MIPVLVVKDIKVRSLSLEFREVSWALEKTNEDVLDYQFMVLGSEGSMGPWEELSPWMEDRYFFIDNRVRAFHKMRLFNYVIRVKHKPSGGTADYGPTGHDAEPDLVALELRSHFNLLMREFVGRRCWVLPRRTFGQHCPACFNATLKQRVRSGCRQCFDTGFVRGYHSPIETWMQLDSSATGETPSNVGLIHQENTTARLGFFPDLKVRDLIIEPENRRWRVTQVNSTQRLRATVHQEVQLHEIPKGDTEYLFPLDPASGTGTGSEPVLFRDMFLSGPRNFTNPHTLESFETDSLPDIVAMYDVRNHRVLP